MAIKSLPEDDGDMETIQINVAEAGMVATRFGQYDAHSTSNPSHRLERH